jgi:hypothetical protein
MIKLVGVAEMCDDENEFYECKQSTKAKYEWNASKFE